MNTVRFFFPTQVARNMARVITKLALSVVMLYSSFILETQASSNTPGKVIAGWIEKITFPQLDEKIKTKLDTGANTSSIFSKDIKKVKREGKTWVKFVMVLKDEHGQFHEIPTQAPQARRAKIKNHDGEHDKRVVVELSFCFDGRQRTAEFTLADRSEYIYSVLLGREFLKDVAVVDASKTFLTQARCSSSK